LPYFFPACPCLRQAGLAGKGVWDVHFTAHQRRTHHDPHYRVIDYLTRPIMLAIVRTDKSVIFDRVVQILDVAKNAGVERLA
jgi:biopolymer transport protein ExbD